MTGQNKLQNSAESLDRAAECMHGDGRALRLSAVVVTLPATMLVGRW